MAMSPSSSHGSAALAVGAVIQRSANVAVNSSDPLPFDTVFSDTSGYFDAVNKHLVIPAGKGGLYVYGAKVGTAATAGLTGLWVELGITGTAANGQFAGAKRPGGVNPRFYAAASFIDVFAAGDIIAPTWELDGVASASMLGGGSGASTFFLAYLGPLS